MGRVSALVRSRVPHWVLVWTVVFAVVGMHHLSAQQPPAHTTTTAVACCAHDAPQEHEHDTLHLCLAVLGAALALAALALAAFRKTAERPGTPLTRAVHRPPGPRGTPALLATLCVLRL
ncbi:hypothetical protein GCM10010492_66090 [Saccharothrix mutabilis subsp. mutabilis]|uniref:Secreted protein n=1 Tax=Saccharothrix mutabilis subsp. mutabilis TaxID=66855 RepID=A0ABP3E8X8_9PSEU